MTFSFFFSFSFFLELRVGHAKKIISALQFIFSFDSIPHLFLQFFVFALIISIWILFLISSSIIWFLKFVFKFNTHFLDCYLFCFESFSWLICFFTNPPLDIYFHLIFVSNLVMLFNCYFLLIFVMDWFFTISSLNI
jgi:hypothetical protein